MFFCCQRKTSFKAENFASAELSVESNAKVSLELKSSSESSLGVKPAPLTRTKKQLEICAVELPSNLTIVKEESDEASDFSLSV